MGVLLLADRRLQRHRLLSNFQDLADLVHGHVHLLADLLGAGIVAQLLQQLAGDADDLVDGLHHMDGDADGAGLIGDGAGDGLPDPPGGVSGELVALGIVKLFHGLDEAQIALLDQVQEQHAAAHVALGDGNHQTEVSLGQLLLGALTGLQLLFQGCHLILGQGLAGLLQFRQTLLCFAAGAHGGGQLHLLIGGEQGDLADLLQVHADGIVDVEAVHQRVGVDQLLLLDLGDLLHGGLAVLVGQGGQEVLGAYLDAQRLQRVVDRVHLVAVQIHLVQYVGQLAGVQTALLLALDEQVLQLFVGVEQRGGGQGGNGFFVQLAPAGRRMLAIVCLLGIFRGLLRLDGGLGAFGLIGGLVLSQQGVGHLLQLLGGIFLVSHVRFPP